MQRVEWQSTAPHLITTLDGTTLDLREAAPKTVRQRATDDCEHAAASTSTVAKDVNDLTGWRGYGRGLKVPTGQSILVGQLLSSSERRDRALQNQLWRKDGSFVPWLEPLRMIVRTAKRGEGRIGAELAIRHSILRREMVDPAQTMRGRLRGPPVLPRFLLYQEVGRTQRGYQRRVRGGTWARGQSGK